MLSHLKPKISIPASSSTSCFHFLLSLLASVSCSHFLVPRVTSTSNFYFSLRIFTSAHFLCHTPTSDFHFPLPSFYFLFPFSLPLPTYTSLFHILIPPYTSTPYFQSHFPLSLPIQNHFRSDFFPLLLYPQFSQVSGVWRKR